MYFTIDAVKELDELKIVTNAPTRIEVIRRALRFYEYVVRKTDEGYKIELVKGKNKELLSPLAVI